MEFEKVEAGVYRAKERPTLEIRKHQADSYRWWDIWEHGQFLGLQSFDTLAEAKQFVTRALKNESDDS